MHHQVSALLLTLLLPRSVRVAGPLRVTLQVCIDMCDGLLYCHGGCGFGPAAVLLHRDVKPSNVLLRRDQETGRLVGALGDFGVSKLCSASMGAVAATGTIYGTAGYIAPELTEGGHPSPQSDAYAAGITILQVGAGGSAANSGVVVLVGERLGVLLALCYAAIDARCKSSR